MRTPQLGDAMWVRAKPGLPQGVRARGGQVFNDRESRAILVSEDRIRREHFVTVSQAAAIVADDSLIVSDEPPYDLHGAVADALIEISMRDEEIAKLREENAALTAQLAAFTG